MFQFPSNYGLLRGTNTLKGSLLGNPDTSISAMYEYTSGHTRYTSGQSGKVHFGHPRVLCILGRAVLALRVLSGGFPDSASSPSESDEPGFPVAWRYAEFLPTPPGRALRFAF